MPYGSETTSMEGVSNKNEREPIGFPLTSKVLGDYARAPEALVPCIQSAGLFG